MQQALLVPVCSFQLSHSAYFLSVLYSLMINDRAACNIISVCFYLLSLGTRISFSCYINSVSIHIFHFHSTTSHFLCFIRTCCNSNVYRCVVTNLDSSRGFVCSCISAASELWINASVVLQSYRFSKV